MFRRLLPLLPLLCSRLGECALKIAHADEVPIYWKKVAQDGEDEQDVLAVATASWAREVAGALGCDFSVDGGIPAVACVSNVTQVLLVYEATNTSEWSACLETLASFADTLYPRKPHLVGVGEGVVRGFDKAHTDVPGFWGKFERRFLMPTQMLQQQERIQCQWFGECYYFDVGQSIFVAAAGAALLPWTSNTFVVINDRGNEVGQDLAFRAFVSGAEYIDPAIHVVRLQVRTNATRSSGIRGRALRQEVSKILELAPVVYLDLGDPLDIADVLRAMQSSRDLFGPSRPSYAILPAFFEAYDSTGAPLPDWSTVVLNSINLDVEAGLRLALASELWSNNGLRPLRIADGYAGTLWTDKNRQRPGELLQKTGSLDQMQDVADLLDRACGEETVETHLNVTVVRRFDREVEEHFDYSCLVSTECCTTPYNPNLDEELVLPPPTCAPHLCPAGIEAAAQAQCGGAALQARTCPVLADRTVKLMGLGVTVNNLADVDVTRGMFYADINIALLEYNDRYSPGDLVNRSKDCRNLELTTRVNVDAEQFLSMISIPATDRFVSVTPRRTGDNSFVNFKGNLFFQPMLAEWPFDRQDLTMSFDSTSTDPQQFCVLQEYTSLTDDIRIAGVNTQSMWDILSFHSDLTEVCWAPYTHPDNQCAVFAEGPLRLCELCQDPARDLGGPPSHASCRCMGGKRPSSRLAFTVSFTRPSGRLALSVFLPPAAIMTLNQAVLFMKIESSETRLSMCSSALLSSVMYHITVMANTPQTAQDSTRADTFMTLCYVVNMLIWLTALTQYLCIVSSNEVLCQWAKESYYYKARICGPLVSIFVCTWIFSSTRQWSDNISLVALSCTFVIAGITCDYFHFKRKVARKKAQAERRPSTECSSALPPTAVGSDAAQQAKEGIAEQAAARSRPAAGVTFSAAAKEEGVAEQAAARSRPAAGRMPSAAAKEASKPSLLTFPDGRQLYANSNGGWGGAAPQGHGSNTELGRRLWTHQPDGTLVCEQGSYRGQQLYTDPAGWVGVSPPGANSNTDPARRTWQKFDDGTIRLADGRQLYITANGGWAGVAREGEHSNTDSQRRTWSAEAPTPAPEAQAVPAQSDYLASTTDELDLALERCVAALGPGCLGGIPLTKAGKTYNFGSKRVALRLDGREVKVRQGSSWLAFADWLMQEGPTQRAMQEGVLSAPGAATEERPLSARSNETHRETEMVASAQSMWMSSDEEFLT